jgi:hypothetical protein
MQPKWPDRPTRHEVACTRVSQDGSCFTDFRRPGPETAYWVEFNLRHRPGDALIVDGEVKTLGWAFSLEQLSERMKTPRGVLKDRRVI